MLQCNIGNWIDLDNLNFCLLDLHELIYSMFINFILQQRHFEDFPTLPSYYYNTKWYVIYIV